MCLVNEISHIASDLFSHFSPVKMGRHKEWRKIAKKTRRKRIRTLKACERDRKVKEEEEKRAQSPSYKKWLVEQEQLELFRQDEEERVRLESHQRWLHEEELAKKRWIEQQERLKRIKAEKIKQELIMKEEWQREQDRLERELEERIKQKERMEREQAEMKEQIDMYVTGEIDRLPDSLITVTETRPGGVECPFFKKVAACRFWDNCSRNHIRPSISKTLLLPGFYSHFRMDQVNRVNEYDTDVGLEFDDSEIYHHFLEFYEDVLIELETYGKVVQFKVCCNEEPHLRGNVYVQYNCERYAITAFRALQGRFYGGKQVSVEFCNISSWKGALCGLFPRNKCPKGSLCNFLHVFRNPKKAFFKADFDIFEDGSPPETSTRRERDEWRWSASPEPTRSRRMKRNSVEKSQEEEVSVRKRSSESYRSKRSKCRRTRSRSRSRSKRRSRSREGSKEVKKKKKK